MSTTTTSDPGTRRAWMLVMGLFSLIGLLLVASCGGLIEYFGFPVTGFEFNPHTYEVRSFVYRASPFTGRQTSGLGRTTDSTPLGLVLSQGNWLPANPDRDDWDLISDSTVGRSADWLASDWGVLVQNVSFAEGWEAWNQKFPEAAAVVWPAVIELGQEGCYDEIVPLLESVMSKPPRLKGLVRDIDRRLAERYRIAAEESGDSTFAEHYRLLAGEPFSQRLSARTSATLLDGRNSLAEPVEESEESEESQAEAKGNDAVEQDDPTGC